MEKKFEYKIDDTLNLHDPLFQNHGVKDFCEIMDSDYSNYFIKRSNSYRAFMLAKKIIKTYLDVVFFDMLENDSSLIVSHRPFIKIKISFLKNFKSKRYFYNIKTQGKFFKAYIILGKRFSIKRDVYFFATSKDKLKDNIMSLIDKGYSWT